MNQRRFPGINPFQTDEQDRFFGRDDDIRDLHALLLLEKMVVLFGKSGHGKSSLLNAGIVPKFLREKTGSERRYEPVIIKFGAWQEGKAAPTEAARQFITAALGEQSASDALRAGQSLWYTARSSGYARILLVFDQFEEFFTYPLPQQQRFAAELGELLHAELPQELADRYADLPEAEQDFLAEKMEVKAVFAVREDRLHLLDKLKYPLPAIFARRYPLQPLPRHRAAEAIAKPAGMAGNFETPAFTFTPDALDALLDYLSDKEGRVETNQLQIIAESFEKRAEQEQLPTFTAANLGDLKHIVARYYRDRIESLDEGDEQLAARKLCEEGLAQESDPPVRLNLHEFQIQNFYSIAPQLLEKLVKNRLLRAEPAASGAGYTYELPHDTLLEPVLDAKRERLRDEARERERRAQEAAEARAREAEAQAVAERRRRQRATLLAVVATIGLIIAAIAGWLAYQQSIEAENERKKAVTLQEKAVEALNNFKKAQADKISVEFHTLYSRAVVILDGKGCPQDLFKDMIQITEDYPDSLQFRERLDLLKRKNPNCL